MSPIFSALRPLNLLLILLSQLVLYFFVLYPVFAYTTIKLQFANGHFFLLSLVTIIICSAGYLINDYFDFALDSHTLKKSQLKSRVHYLILYYALFIIGLFMSYYLANYIGQFNFIFIYIFAFIVLFLYSSWLKSTVLIGNIVIGLFTSGVVLILLLAEYKAIGELGELDSSGQTELLSIFSFYAIFALLVNVFREIVKDVEDQENDCNFNIITLATNCSLKGIKSILFLILLLIASLVTYWLVTILDSSLLNKLIGMVLLLIPNLIMCAKLYTASDQKDYQTISILSKVYMFTGLLFIVLYKWI